LNEVLPQCDELRSGSLAPPEPSVGLRLVKEPISPQCWRPPCLELNGHYSRAEVQAVFSAVPAVMMFGEEAAARSRLGAVRAGVTVGSMQRCAGHWHATVVAIHDQAPAFQWAMACVVEMLTPVQPALLWYQIGAVNRWGFQALAGVRTDVSGVIAQLPSCCPDKTWLPY